jgi:hypothetical protein
MDETSLIYEGAWQSEHEAASYVSAEDNKVRTRGSIFVDIFTRRSSLHIDHRDEDTCSVLTESSFVFTGGDDIHSPSVNQIAPEITSRDLIEERHAATTLPEDDYDEVEFMVDLQIVPPAEDIEDISDRDRIEKEIMNRFSWREYKELLEAESRNRYTPIELENGSRTEAAFYDICKRSNRLLDLIHIGMDLANKTTLQINEFEIMPQVIRLKSLEVSNASSMRRPSPTKHNKKRKTKQRVSYYYCCCMFQYSLTLHHFAATDEVP